MWRASLDVLSIAPLISANWNQGGEWNDYCPNNSLVGCVAVAMGQVMNYWNHPAQGYGYSQYYDQNHGVIGVNFEDYSCPNLHAAYLKHSRIKDFKEKNLRKTLNLGHTFGHAYEACLGYSRKLNHKLHHHFLDILHFSDHTL